MRKHIPEADKKYLRIAKQALQDTYGFSPAMSDIVLLETGMTGDIVDLVVFAVGGKGYRWSIGWPVERAEYYDLGQQR